MKRFTWLSVLICAIAALQGCGGGDADEQEAAATNQPVDCASSPTRCN